MNSISDNVVATLQRQFKGLTPVALHEPNLSGEEGNFALDCIDTGWVSSAGAYVDQFEKDLAAFTGVKRAVAIVNGTAALHLALHLVGVRRDDEVLVPALSFVATANACHYLGSIPHFIDSCETTLGVDPNKLREYLHVIAEPTNRGCRNKQTGRIIRALVPMHTFGHPVDMEPLLKICQTFGIEMVEDAAESLGSYSHGRHTGGAGQVSALSFNGNKIVTTGGGGALLINDDELADLAKHLSTTAKNPHPYLFQHDQLGFNYRMPNINAALGCGQLKRLNGFLENKRQLFKIYHDLFSDVDGVRIFEEPAGAKSNYWLQVLLLDKADLPQRDDILEQTNSSGIMTRPAWELLSGLSFNKICPSMDLSGAENLATRIITLPSSPSLVAKLSHL
jgi:perosamine synthetase